MEPIEEITNTLFLLRNLKSEAEKEMSRHLLLPHKMLEKHVIEQRYQKKKLNEIEKELMDQLRIYEDLL